MKDKYKLKDKGLGDLVREAITLGNRLHSVPELFSAVEEEYFAVTKELNERGAKYERATYIAGENIPLR